MEVNKELYQVLQPGVDITGDWCAFPTPTNIIVGENTYIDTSACFRKYYSKLPLGLKIGNNVTLQGPGLAPEINGYIEIGDHCFISSAIIAATEKIIIGNYVYIAGGVTIVDTDFHPIDPALRMRDTIAVSTIGDKTRRPQFDSAPVIIEDDVWIGYNATILKGVTIGKGSVIHPGSVVTKNVPDGSVVSGNPAELKKYEHV